MHQSNYMSTARIEKTSLTTQQLMDLVDQRRQEPGSRRGTSLNGMAGEQEGLISSIKKEEPKPTTPS